LKKGAPQSTSLILRQRQIILLFWCHFYGEDF
jgi:hypothetical protein